VITLTVGTNLDAHDGGVLTLRRIVPQAVARLCKRTVGTEVVRALLAGVRR
jgi:hypothetical protein